jgi:hypothetical protein
MKENKELVGLLFKKQVSENSMEKYAKGFTIYSNLCEEIKIALKDKKLSKLEKSRLQAELDKSEWESRIFGTNYKSTQREYIHNLMPSIEKIATEEDKKSIKFIAYKEEADKLAKNEIFGKCIKYPANVELPQILNSIKHLIEILEHTNSELNIILDDIDSLSKLEICKIQKELFDNEIHLQTLKKRLANREDYYYNQFMPIYVVELAEAKEKLESYYERGCQLAEKQGDPQLPFILQRYEDHRYEDEKIWLYFGALKSKVNGLIEEINSDKTKYKDLIYLTEPI